MYNPPAYSYRSDYYSVNATSLNVRQYPSTYAPIIDRLSKGVVVEVLSISGDWTQIRYGLGKSGYVAAVYLSPR